MINDVVLEGIVVKAWKYAPNEPLFGILDELHKRGASGHKGHRCIFRTERYRCQNFPSLSHNTLTSAEEYIQ